MLTRILQVALTLAIAAAVGWAQDAPVDQGREAAAPAEKAPGSGADFPDLRKAARDKVKVLAPKDVPGELKRLKSKADIKAEITVNVTGNSRASSATASSSRDSTTLPSAFWSRRSSRTSIAACASGGRETPMGSSSSATP